jgi:hypothetical protein
VIETSAEDKGDILRAFRAWRFTKRFSTMIPSGKDGWRWNGRGRWWVACSVSWR